MSAFYWCPVCEADDHKCAHAKIVGHVQLLPCPFCEGPPVPSASSDVHGFAGFGEEGALISAHVFCHECGARSQKVDELIFEAEEVPALVEKAVLLWNTRNARHRHLYNAGEAEGLNLYPRPAEKGTG